MQKISLFLLILLAGSGLRAQTNLDSLYNVWQDADQLDSLRAVAYYNYIWKGILFSNPDTAFLMAEELVDFGMEENYPRAIAIGYNILGASCYIRSDYPKAMGFYKQSLTIQKLIGENAGVSMCLNNIGLIYTTLGNYPRALDYYLQGLKIDEQIGDQKGIAQSLNNIGIIYNNQGDYPKALEYYTKSLEIKEKIGDQMGVSASYNNIGIIYQDQGDYEKALDYHTRSLEIKQEINDQMGIAPSLQNIGIIYERQGDFNKALEYFYASLKIKEQIGDQKGIAQSLNDIGKVYLRLGDFPQALDYCDRSYELALSLGALAWQQSSCECLYNTYKAMGEGARALEYHEFLNIIKDSLQAEETARQLQQMEFRKAMLVDSIAKAEEDRLIKEAHEQEVRTKNRSKNIFLISGIVFIIVSFVLWRGLQFVRKSRKLIAHEKEKSENLLLNILPAEIAEELKRTGKAKPRKYDHVSILFTDFVGFTELSERMNPESLVSEINTCYKKYDHIIEKWGVEKIKTIGDAYMAADGFTKTSSLAARNIVLAALEIIEFTEQRNKINEKFGKAAFTIRAGIHTGTVIAGIVGEKKFQFDIWGNAVNIASRMESCSEPGRVNVSRDTVELLKHDDELEFESRGIVEVKGKGKMEMWFAKKK